MTSHRPAALGALSMHNRYSSPSLLDGWLVVGVSQSGATPEVVEYITAARSNGARIVAVTNIRDAPLAAAAELAIALDVGAEEAVPATKTFTASVVALLCIAEALGPAPWEGQWDGLADAVAGCIDDQPSADIIGRVAERERILVVARGMLTAAAHETALKLQETTGRNVNAYLSADLYHGPIASYGSETVAIVVGVDGSTASDAVEIAYALEELGASLVRVGSADPEPDLATPPLHDALSVITASVRGQQLAFGISRRLGFDPDQPVGLRKVTLTR